jgi:hypothetical protein
MKRLGTNSLDYSMIHGSCMQHPILPPFPFTSNSGWPCNSSSSGAAANRPSYGVTAAFTGGSRASCKALAATLLAVVGYLDSMYQYIEHFHILGAVQSI